MQWTTGDADGGVNGLGGNPAQVGFNRGDGTEFGEISSYIWKSHCHWY